jgi:hypothetical protein
MVDADIGNKHTGGMHGRNTPLMSPMPSIAESLSSIGSGGSFPDRSKKKSKLQRMVERARDEDRRHQQAIREHKLHEEKPLFLKMAEKAAMEANREEKTKVSAKVTREEGL